MRLTRLLCVLAICLPYARAVELPKTMAASPHPYTEVNADGTVTSLIYIKGGEMGSPAYEVTDEGYTVDKVNGNYKYLEMDEAKGVLVDSGLMCGKDDPKKAVGRSGKKLAKGLKGRAGHSGKGTARFTNNGRRVRQTESEYSTMEERSQLGRRRIEVIGNKKNLIIPFKFKDHSARVVPSIANLNVYQLDIFIRSNSHSILSVVSG